MPISEEQWEEAIPNDPILLKAREFLEANYPQAYTVHEVVENLNLTGMTNAQTRAVRENVIHDLDVLAALEVVECRDIDRGHQSHTFYRAASS